MDPVLPPLTVPNTFRDSNDTTNTKIRELVLPSAPPSEDMDFNSSSIVRPVDSDSFSSSLTNSTNQNRLTNQPIMKSIVRSNENDGDDESTPDYILNRTLINNNNNSTLEAAGYDSTRLAEMDADAAFALQLQQEEYSKDSIIPNRHQFSLFQVEPDDDSVATAASTFIFDPDNPQVSRDQQVAAFLQQQDENQTRQRRQRPPIPFFQMRQNSNPASSQPSDTDEHLVDPTSPPFARFAHQRSLYNQDESDDDNPYMNFAEPLLQFLANRRQHLPEDFPAFFPGFHGRVGYRRSGNLQDTEDDFGPEDYERLLQLDDTVHKKKITKEQIKSIPTEQFRRTSNNSDEENKCGVCLEHFEVNQTLRRFPCRHLYHKECADRWLQESNACPICRKPPVTTQLTTNTRSSRDHHHPRRPPHSNRYPVNRNNPTNSSHNHQHNNNNNNNTNNPHHNYRRGSTPHQRPS